jgi:hypothetical protein
MVNKILPILNLGNHLQFIEDIFTRYSSIYPVDIWVVDNHTSVFPGAGGRIIGFTLRLGDQLLYLGHSSAF